VERLARGSGWAEIEVVRRPSALAGRPERPGQPAGQPRQHVGYYLIDRGRTELEADIRYRPALRQRLLNLVLTYPRAVYFGGIALVTALVLTGLGLYAFRFLSGAGGVALLAALLLLSVVPASEMAVGLVNFFVTSFLPPRVLPKLDFKEGVPADCATFVVMPAMLIGPRSATMLVQRLE